MGPLAARQVVIVHFPFSNLTASKLRSAAVLAEAEVGSGARTQLGIALQLILPSNLRNPAQAHRAVG